MNKETIFCPCSDTEHVTAICSALSIYSEYLFIFKILQLSQTHRPMEEDLLAIPASSITEQQHGALADALHLVAEG